MSYLVDKPPTEDQLLQTGQRVWELPTHKPTLTATRGAYKPYSTYVSFFFFHFFQKNKKHHQCPDSPFSLSSFAAREGGFGVVGGVCIGRGKGEVVDVAVCETIGANIWELPGAGGYRTKPKYNAWVPEAAPR